MEQRVILHIDMNSYFATVEQQANPLLRGKPIAVSGRPHIHSVVAAASIEAKKYGVKSGMNTIEAKRLCPHLIFIPGDPAKYIDLTGKFVRIFRDYTPLVEIFSIDEVFLQLFPPYNDFEVAVRIAGEIKKRVREEVGSIITCSIGIAENKLLAKLASEKKKPDGLIIIDEHNLDEVLLGSELMDFCGIGHQVFKRLQNMGVCSVSQLRKLPIEVLTAGFGAARGQQIYNMARGIDEAPLVPEYEAADPKSYSHTLTLDKATTNRQYVEAVLLRLAEKVARRMRGDGFCGRVIHSYIRHPEEGGFGGQRLISYYTDDGEDIFQIGRGIIDEALNKFPVRALGIGIGQVVKKELVPYPLLAELQKKEKIVSAMDFTNDRFGENTVFRAASSLAFPREVRVAGIRTRLRFN